MDCIGIAIKLFVHTYIGYSHVARAWEYSLICSKEVTACMEKRSFHKTRTKMRARHNSRYGEIQCMPSINIVNIAMKATSTEQIAIAISIAITN